MIDRVKVISLGAGVQSSALLLMSDKGELIPRADFAVFADTGAEPEEVYEWLRKLQTAVSIPIIVASGGNIAEDVVSHWRGQLNRVGQPPFRAVDKDGKRSMLRRHCTHEYKIKVVDQAIRRKLGYPKYHKMKHKVDVYIGISYDEMGRMKDAREEWKTHKYPLVDMKIRRPECIKWVEETGLGTPPRSACWFCPYKTNAEWKHLRDKDPVSWGKAVEFDKKIRTSLRPSLSSQFFVHTSGVPLDKVDLGAKDEDRQFTFADECDGMCGV